MRLQLFEFEDQSWFPDVIRVGGTDYLRYFLIATELYKPVVPIIAQALADTNEEQIIDLCSGGGGYMEQAFADLQKTTTKNVSVLLTDKFPNIEAYRLIKQRTNGRIDFASDSVDATQVPTELKGLKVIFSAIHHFRPKQVQAILQNAVDNNSPIAVFDGGDKNIVVILGMMIFHPIAFFLFTPFFKPFKWSRLLFTYIIPLIPLYTVWDGCVSVLRMYTADELLKIAEATGTDYKWKAGRIKNRFGIHSTYLVGYPATNNKSTA